MNNIPEGYKLVPVKPTQEMLDAAFGKVGGEFYKAALAAAPAPPQPTYDEAKERELFEPVFPPCSATFWREEDREYYSELYPDQGGQDYQRTWEGWKACAQSRAKAGEDE